MRDDIAPIATLIKSAWDLTEGTFLETGRRLGSSVEMLEQLTVLFGTLQAEIASDAFRSATDGLTAVARQASALAGSRREERTALGELGRVARGLQRRIGDIAKEVRTIGVLTVNARITATSIGSAGTEFLDYIGGIGNSLKITESNLALFREELVQVGRHLDAAAAREADFDARFSEAVMAVPRQLGASIDLITSRCQAAATAAADVGARSRRVADGIARVVMALQVGDATRQRMEHVESSATLLDRVMVADGAGAPWSDLPPEERRALVAAGCALQAAQLNDAADELRREIGSVHDAIGRLASESREIVHLGRVAYGSASQAEGSFLQELEEDVRRARLLFDGFRAARVSADQVMTQVLGISSRLVEHIGTVRGVEADIRIMGVNATLKSCRLGAVGRPLGVIAEELTQSSGRTGSEAVAATSDVEAIVGTARSLAGTQQSERMAEFTTVTTRMDESIARLHGIAETLTSALAALARDGVTVSDSLDETGEALTTAEKIEMALRDAANRFAAIAGSPRPRVPEGGAAERLYGLLSEQYTMAREREIHARVLPGTLGATAAAAPAETAIDDMLF